MKQAIKKKNWCNLPDSKYARETDDLYKVGSRVDAWRGFFGSPASRKIKKLPGNIIWFSKWEHFEKLIVEIDLPEDKAVKIIRKLMLHSEPIEFLRSDIYDSRAWCELPLSCFVKTKGFNKRTDNHIMQYDVLKYNQMPIVQFGIKKAWAVSRGCFTFSHKIKNDERYAQLSFDHPQQDERFEGRRWVADGTFPRTATRREMEAALFAKAEAECREHMVTIIKKDDKNGY